MTIQEHVAQDSRTAHKELMDDLDRLKAEVTDIYCAKNYTEFYDAIKVIDTHINELIQKHK